MKTCTCGDAYGTLRATLKELRRLDIAACDPDAPREAAIEALHKLADLEQRERALRAQIKECSVAGCHVRHQYLNRTSAWYRGRGWYWHVVTEWDKQGRIGDDSDFDMQIH